MRKDVGKGRAPNHTPTTDVIEKQRLLLDELRRLKMTFASVSAEVRAKLTGMTSSSFRVDEMLDRC